MVMVMLVMVMSDGGDGGDGDGDSDSNGDVSNYNATQNTHNTVAASPLVSCPSVKMESMAF